MNQLLQQKVIMRKRLLIILGLFLLPTLLALQDGYAEEISNSEQAEEPSQTDDPNAKDESVDQLASTISKTPIDKLPKYIEGNPDLESLSAEERNILLEKIKTPFKIRFLAFGINALLPGLGSLITKDIIWGGIQTGITSIIAMLFIMDRTGVFGNDIMIVTKNGHITRIWLNEGHNNYYGIVYSNYFWLQTFIILSWFSNLILSTIRSWFDYGKKYHILDSYYKQHPKLSKISKQVMLLPIFSLNPYSYQYSFGNSHCLELKTNIGIHIIY